MIDVFSDTLFIFKAIEYFSLEERRERKKGRKERKKKINCNIICARSAFRVKTFLTLLS